MGKSKSPPRCIGILTSGGDCPGLNAAIRAVTKSAIQDHDMKVIGIMDGFRGLVENRTRPLRYQDMSGMLALGEPSWARRATSPTRCGWGRRCWT